MREPRLRPDTLRRNPGARQHLHHVGAGDLLQSSLGAMPEVSFGGLFDNATPPNNGWEQRFEISGKQWQNNSERVLLHQSGVFLRAPHSFAGKDESGMKARRCTDPSSH